MRAFLYTWGGGRTTAEGEHIPFRMDPIELQHADHISLVLPLTLEHEIDERSPLYGHTYDSLTVRSRHPLHLSHLLRKKSRISHQQAKQMLCLRVDETTHNLLRMGVIQLRTYVCLKCTVLWRALCHHARMRDVSNLYMHVLPPSLDQSRRRPRAESLLMVAAAPFAC